MWDRGRTFSFLVLMLLVLMRVGLVSGDDFFGKDDDGMPSLNDYGDDEVCMEVMGPWWGGIKALMVSEGSTVLMVWTSKRSTLLLSLWTPIRLYWPWGPSSCVAPAFFSRCELCAAVSRPPVSSQWPTSSFWVPSVWSY